MQKLVLLYFILLASCASPHRPPMRKQIPKIGFIREIPMNKEGFHKGDTSILYKFKRVDARVLGLDYLEDGFDSIEMRFWLGADLARFKQLVVITNQGGNWYGLVVTYKSESRTDTARGISWSENVVVSTKDVTPSGGWDGFLKETKDFQITTFPNFADVAGRDGCGADGIIFYFEVATKEKYRFYYYCDPDKFSAKFWQAKNVLEFAALLEKEFDFQYTR